MNSNILIECDVNNENNLQNTVNQIKKGFGKIDFIIHAVAYSDKNELNGRYLDTSKNNFINGVNVLDGLLFFTDNLNEPRVIKIEKFKFYSNELLAPDGTI